MWSAKHHAPTVRRSRRGSARRTGIAPTVASRLGVISTHADLTAPARDSAGGASTVLTGPLIAATVPPGEVRVERVPGGADPYATSTTTLPLAWPCSR
jgi:hypothetical protein